MSNKIYFFLTISLLFVGFIEQTGAQILPPTFSQHKYGILNYDFFVPSNYDDSQKYPLILYFHGYNDTVKKSLNWYNSNVQSVNPCFVLAPKCPRDDTYGWGDSWNEGYSPRMELALEVLDSIIKKYSIDTNKLYIYGTSMGGFGTFDVLANQPGRFAAAMVLCGGGNPETAEQVSKTPLWIFHGNVDRDVEISLSRNLYTRMIEIGADQVHFTEYPNIGHNVWDYAPGDPAWPTWIFHYTKGAERFYERPDSTIKLSCKLRYTGLGFELKWNNINNPADRKNKIWFYKLFRDGIALPTLSTEIPGYTDLRPGVGVHTYKIVAVNYDFMVSDTATVSGEIITSVNREEKPVVYDFSLSQNSPNPFNPSTKIQYTLGGPSNVNLTVFDLIGKEIKVLVNEYQKEGVHEVNWDGKDNSNHTMSSGIYFYKLETSKFISTKKMVLLK